MVGASAKTVKLVIRAVLRKSFSLFEGIENYGQYHYDYAGFVGCGPCNHDLPPFDQQNGTPLYTRWRILKTGNQGEVTKKADGLGNEQTWTYNGAGQPVRAKDAYGNETKYDWNAIGKIAQVTYPDLTTENYAYNHLGQVSRITDAAGTQWEGIYDEAGRLWKETGRPGINKEYRYDALGRVVEVKNGGEVTERYSYANRGRQATFTDGAGNTFQHEKNEFAELVGEVNRLGDRETYSYDKEGRPISIAEYSGKQVRAVYNDASGTTTIEYSDGSRIVKVLDRAGNTTSVSGETGTIRYRYDAGGKLVIQNDETSGERTEYRYDAAGQRIQMLSGNRDVRYTYGKNGELLRVLDNSQRLSVQYEYDTMGREIRRTFGNGVKQETQYDSIGRTVLIRELDARGELIRAEGYLYDTLGRRTHSVDEQGQVTRYEYDNQSRLASVWSPYSEEKALMDRKEAEEAGLFFTLDKGQGVRYTLSAAELSALREVLDKASINRGSLVNMNQILWQERYTYDRNGNRASKITPWGTIAYTYDRENRMITKGDIRLTYDKNGNLLSERGTRKTATYQYNGQNRMASSEVAEAGRQSRSTAQYRYDAYGRRTITQETGKDAMRTIYDGFSFDVIREGVTFVDGSLTSRYATGAISAPQTQNDGTRYRYLGEDTTGGDRSRTLGEDGTNEARYTGIAVTLYGRRGEAVAVSRSASTGSRGGAAYLGKDLLGSVRSTTGDMGTLEARYEYDAFGKPYKGEFSTGMSLGYTGKPYDTATGIYNYGYRDYKPEQARFTSVDPIRDGNNWFAYVNNDPVNYYDPLGLSKSGVVAGLISRFAKSGLDIKLWDPIDTLIFQGDSDATKSHKRYYKGVQKTKKLDGFFVVAGHGNPQGMVDDRDGLAYSGGQGVGISVATLAAEIVSTGWNFDEPILLLSCETGKGSKSFAEQLSMELHLLTGKDAIVIGASEKDYVKTGTYYGSGDYGGRKHWHKTGEIYLENNGSWNVFKNGQSWFEVPYYDKEQ
ncbi:hypothetical protein AGMMS50267_02030 [Spirochaetia bacterium]|nr:hypothetical protein AGMMS50267_02030 [Spirochaetia bacterium]